jgi:hypothetical protein
MNTINPRRNPWLLHVVLKVIACLMLAAGAISCAGFFLVPMTISVFGHSMTVIKVHPMALAVDALLLVGGLAILFSVMRRSH